MDALSTLIAIAVAILAAAWLFRIARKPLVPGRGRKGERKRSGSAGAGTDPGSGDLPGDFTPDLGHRPFDIGPGSH